MSNVGSAQPNITFATIPENTEFSEGDNVNFTCIPLADGVPGIAAWRVTPVGQSEVAVSNITSVPGTTDSYLLGENTTTMVLVNVSTILNGATITCIGFDPDRTILGVNAVPPAILTLESEWGQVRCVRPVHALAFKYIQYIDLLFIHMKYIESVDGSKS